MTKFKTIEFHHPEIDAVVTGKPICAPYENNADDNPRVYLCVDVTWHKDKRPVTLYWSVTKQEWLFFDYAYMIGRLFPRKKLVNEITFAIWARFPELIMPETLNGTNLKDVDKINFTNILQSFLN